ncbi:Uncharacterised protein [uncultured archaeon]|nr:Uncharacterised protein [uncultured archaeon]
MGYVIRNLLKALVILFVINGALNAVQAVSDANLPINAQLGKILSIEVKTTSLNWNLDPANSPFTDQIKKENGVVVSTNMLDAWTVSVKADPEKLSDGTNKVASYMDLSPSDQDWGEVYDVNMGEPGEMWLANGKRGVDRAALKFSQPVSWDDVPSTYKTVIKFTVGSA